MSIRLPGSLLAGDAEPPVRLLSARFRQEASAIVRLG